MFLTNLRSGEDPFRPSYFEMVAQGQLIGSLKPALLYVLRLAARSRPRLGRAVQLFDELFAALMLALEGHHLRRHGGSFAENFYGLRREGARRRGGGSGGRGPEAAPLTARQRRGALLFLVVLPYARGRVERAYRALTEAGDEDGFENRDAYDPATEADRPAPVRWWRAAVYRAYPALAAAADACSFVYSVRYLFGFSPYYSPALHALRQRVRRLTADEMTAQARGAGAADMQRLWEQSARGRAPLVVRAAGAAAEYAKTALLVAVAAFKFAEWWYSESNRLQPQGKLPVPPPPPEAEPSARGLRLPRDRRRCAVCDRTRTNPACTPAGFVYCYPCVFAYVQDHGRCPVSQSRCTTEQVRRVYEN